MDAASLLIVDADVPARCRLEAFLRDRVGRILVAHTGGEAIALAEQHDVRVAFVEFLLPDRSGLGLLWELRRLRPELRGVVVTAHATVETSIEALRFGVADIAIKPVGRSAALAALDRALAGKALAPIAPGVAPAVEREESISVPLAGSLKQIERRVVQEVILRHDGNKAAAARTLGMHRKALYRLLQTKAKD